MRFVGGSQWHLVSDIILPLVQGLDEFSMNIQNRSEYTGQCFNLGLVDHGLHW
jgi:hypothetical protein